VVVGSFLEMSLKQEIESWVEALAYYDEQDYERALDIFEQNADTSKIYFNIGMIHATLGEHERAVEAYTTATKLDSFLAVAFFQMGVSNFLLGEFEVATTNFNESLLYLRGNTLIDYDQLGLKFKLYSCEVLFNRGLCYIYDDQVELGMKDLEYAAKEKQVEDHNVIDEAILEKAEGYTVFSVGVGVLYRPNESKVRNVKTKDYLGKARLVAATDVQNAFTGFSGAEVKKQESSIQPVDDRAPEEISFAATNLVKPELSSRRFSEAEEVESASRLEIPPLSVKDTSGLKEDLQVYPPTPPPENEIGRPTRANTVVGRSLSQHRGTDRGRAEGGLDAVYGPAGRHLEPRRAFSTRAVPNNGTGSAARSRSVREPRGRDFQSRDLYAQQSREISRRRAEYLDEMNSNPYEDEVEPYSQPRNLVPQSRPVQGVRRGPSQRIAPRYEDEDEYASDAYEGSDFDDEEFEMLDVRAMRSGSVRRPEAKKIKIKAHYGDETRMIMISTIVDYREFVQRLQDKFNLQSECKCKIKDEDGDGMICVLDQEDLDMAIATAKAQARKERSEFGKFEIWVHGF
jgi:hypothetical protein